MVETKDKRSETSGRELADLLDSVMDASMVVL